MFLIIPQVIPEDYNVCLMQAAECIQLLLGNISFS